jgi:hypothetical protein
MRSVPTASLDLLWFCVPLMLIWLFVALTPIPPNDLWWHMAAGRLMVNEGRIIAENRWSYTLPADTPYVFQSWLSEIIMYGTWHLGGVPLLAMLRLCAISGGYALVGWHAMRHSSGRATALALIVAALVGWNNWTLRPQTLAMPVGAAFLVVLGEYLAGSLPKRWLALLPLLMLLWVNLHGSFILGLGLLGAALAGALLQRQPITELAIAFATSLLAALCNPLGLGILGYLQTMLGNNINQSMIVEWQPPQPSFDFLGFGFWFYAMLLGLPILMALGKERPRLAELLWYAGLGWLALNGLRYVMWFGFLLTPLLARRIGLLLPDIAPQRSVVATGFLLFLGLSAFTVLPWFNPANTLGLASNPIYAQSGPDRSLLSGDTPRDAAVWLGKNPIPGRLWVDMSVTSYLVWALPERQVFTDQRVELFPEAIWDDFFAIARGNTDSLKVIERWQISHLLLHRDWQRNLIALLETTPGWCKAYEDDVYRVIRQCET